MGQRGRERLWRRSFFQSKDFLLVVIASWLDLILMSVLSSLQKIFKGLLQGTSSRDFNSFRSFKNSTNPFRDFSFADGN